MDLSQWPPWATPKACHRYLNGCVSFANHNLQGIMLANLVPGKFIVELESIIFLQGIQQCFRPCKYSLVKHPLRICYGQGSNVISHSLFHNPCNTTALISIYNLISPFLRCTEYMACFTSLYSPVILHQKMDKVEFCKPQHHCYTQFRDGINWPFSPTSFFSRSKNTKFIPPSSQ
jgi:hypothetical protein